MTRSIKEMGFQNMFMSLIVMVIRGPKVRLAAAGMPFPLLYRADSQTVEIVTARGMPLGSFTDYPYQADELHLATGDTLLFMSDGLLEYFNRSEEMLGNARTQAFFEEVAAGSPQSIIDHLVKRAEEWSQGRPPEDDMTFLVLKYLGDTPAQQSPPPVKK
jgi:serine phosphatase RsbU (regulator of sigma subunit)